MTTLNDFFGKYTVKTANLTVPVGWSYDGPSVEIGQELSIDDDGQGGAVLNTNGNSYPFSWSPQDLALQRVYQVTATAPVPGEELLPVITQISLVSDGTYKAIYAATVAGDPQQVGVWGADNGGG